MSESIGTTAVLFLNLGGPDSLKAVRPFLYNLFSDREIIRLGPSFLQKPLAYLISTLRSGKTEGAYKLIGGKSPILDITNAQAHALEEQLNRQPATQPGKGGMRVYVAMRYWHPFIEEVIPRIVKDGVKRVVVLSLYPQYSVATTGSSLSRLKKVISNYPLEIFSIEHWYDNPLYIDSLVAVIRKGLESFGSLPGNQIVSPDEIHILFSAHSLPVRFIEEGDPYVDQTKRTIEEITKKMPMNWDLSYQSKSGPVHWLEPSTDAMIEGLAGRGIKNILAVPISFVSDHIETLYEIDMLYKDMAEKLGMRLERAESLNTSDLFIKALADIVRRGLEDAGWKE